ncbi:MAG: alkylated DNA repair protein alkB family protein 7 [Bacillariaceae sp.]
MKKSRRYEKGHWDAVINLYKEVELADISFQEGDGNSSDEESIPNVFKRVRQQLEEHHLLSDYYDDRESIHWLPCHAIDLKKDGELKAHVDSVRFSGDLVAGLSLLSPSIMRLIPCEDNDDDDDDDDDKKNKNSTTEEEEAYVDLYLPPRSLYVLTGVGRYKYSHQLLPDGSIFHRNDTDITVRRDHRLSVIFRDSKPSS